MDSGSPTGCQDHTPRARAAYRNRSSSFVIVVIFRGAIGFARLSQQLLVSDDRREAFSHTARAPAFIVLIRPSQRPIVLPQTTTQQFQLCSRCIPFPQNRDFSRTQRPLRSRQIPHRAVGDSFQILPLFHSLHAHSPQLWSSDRHGRRCGGWIHAFHCLVKLGMLGYWYDLKVSLGSPTVRIITHPYVPHPESFPYLACRDSWSCVPFLFSRIWRWFLWRRE